VPREQWALGRTKAFLAVASGGEVPGYEADRDLLPDAHPLAVKAAPMLTVEAPRPVGQAVSTDGIEPVLTPGQAVGTEVEEKVAVTVATGEHLDSEAVQATIDRTAEVRPTLGLAAIRSRRARDLSVARLRLSRSEGQLPSEGQRA
jgi:hypothetical protein